MFLHPPEPDRAVQPECGRVVDRRVDEAVRQAPAHHPVQRVDGQRAAVAATLDVGSDGEALEVAVVGRRAGDGESDHSTATPEADPSGLSGAIPRGGRGCGATDLGELIAVVTPAGAEGGVVDGGGGGEVLPSHRARRSLGAGAETGGGAHLRAVEDGAQQREAIGHLEPGGLEPLGGAEKQGGTANGGCLRVRRGDVVEAVAHLVEVGNYRIVAQPDVDQVGVAGRWADHQRPQRTRGPNAHCVPQGTVARRRRSSVVGVTVLFATHPLFLEHVTGAHHPERPSRLAAVATAACQPHLAEAVTPLEPRPATRIDLERVHPAWYLDRLEHLAAAGGGWIDADTATSAQSAAAATLAAGAGLTAVAALQRGEGVAAFCAVRPPGHHATPTESMGFCLVSNIAVVAAALAAAGERVWIFDFDAHHGNGTQAVFYDDPRVLFVSTHQWPLYPGTGRRTETGVGTGAGTTVNIPLPPETTGDVYLRAFDEVVAPIVDRFAPTWLLISAGFDAHRADPLTDLGLSAGDFAALTSRAVEHVAVGRTVAMLEGGYDLDALTASTAAVLGILAGLTPRLAAEPATSGGPGADAVIAVRDQWQRAGAP
jgi:acetoin utilization deacetylase AcuC-like enzyme